MNLQARASDPTPVPTGTLAKLFVDAVDRLGEAPALRWFADGEWLEISYDEVATRVGAAVGGLRRMGLERGDRVAILSENRPEWAILDYACLVSGVQDVPVYPTLTPKQIGYILRDSGARGVFVSGGDLVQVAAASVEEVGGGLPIVVFDGAPGTGDDTTAWSEFLAAGPADGPTPSWREEAALVRPEDLATLIYTSGTTGDPKGVMLTQNNIFSNVTASSMRLTITPEDDTLSFLPLSHSFQRTVDYLLFSVGCTIAYARSIDTVAEDLRAVRPTVVVSVPRLYEKVYSRVMAASGLKGALVRWARGVAMERARCWFEGRTPGAGLRLQHRLADGLVFSTLRKGLGGRLRFFVSGGAPLEPEIMLFFHGAGVRILEGYGLTETSPVTNVNTLEEQRVGTVGKPIPSTEIGIAEDGEVLVRGPQVMKGYLGRPEETASVIDAEGWFHTGDIGVLEDGGYLRITDRKKSLFKTSGGKYIVPAPIENRLKTSRFIDHAVVVGEGRKFPAVLLAPAPGALAAWVEERGGEAHELRGLMALEPVRELLWAEVSSLIEDISHYERPKKAGVILDDVSIESGLLTPTQKVKRKVVLDRYSALIDALYRPENLELPLIVQGEP